MCPVSSLSNLMELPITNAPQQGLKMVILLLGAPQWLMILEYLLEEEIGAIVSQTVKLLGSKIKLVLTDIKYIYFFYKLGWFIVEVVLKIQFALL